MKDTIYSNHHQSSSHHWMHKALTVSLQCEWCCATFWISPQVKCIVLSSFSVDLLQVVLGLPGCLFPSGVQNRPSLAMSLGSFFSMCPIQVHFLCVKLTMMSSWLQILRIFWSPTGSPCLIILRHTKVNDSLYLPHQALRCQGKLGFLKIQKKFET